MATDLIDAILTDHREVERVFTELEQSSDARHRQQLVEHAEAEEVMKRLESADADDPDFDKLVRQLIDEVRHHLREEEGDLLPKLRGACTAEELRELGEKFERSKKLAPTRPHPAAPDHPPANKILGPGLGMIDRLRDALTGRGRTDDNGEHPGVGTDGSLHSSSEGGAGVGTDGSLR